MKAKPVDLATAIPLPVKITSPCSGESFNGTASGTYSPISNTPTWIKYYFWKDVPGGSPVGSADVEGNASFPDPVTGMWALSMTLPAGSGTKGFLRVTKRFDGNDDSNDTRDLTWPPAGMAVAVKKGAKGKGEAQRAFSTPNVLIQEPENGSEVPRLFLVYGDFNSGSGNTVSVRLFRPDGTEALATILPVANPYGIQWVTAILAYEGGIGYRIQASLLDSHGTPVPPAFSVGIAID